MNNDFNGPSQLKHEQLLFHAEAFQQIVWHPYESVNFLEPQGAILPGFNPPWRGQVYCQVLEAPLSRGMLMRPKAFLELSGVSGLRPCAWTHQKNGLLPHSSIRWDIRQISLSYRALLFMSNIQIFLIIFTNPAAWAGYDTVSF